MPVVKLDARSWTSLKERGGKRTEYRDEKDRGFFLRVTPQGKRSFGIF